MEMSPAQLRERIDALEHTNADLQTQLQELRTICAVFAYLNGRDVGLGSFQLHLPVDVAFEVRQNLPARPHVMIDQSNGALVITVV